MSKATFGTKQALKSLEFGTLLHDIIQKGVYKQPTISYDNNQVSVTGGVFLFYDTTVSNYAVRVENVSVTLSNVPAGDYVFISYTYDASQQAEPVLTHSAAITSDNSTIRLGRLVQVSADPSNLQFDSSSMEMCGPGFSIDNGLVKYLNFKYNENGTPVIEIALNNKVMTNSGFATITQDLSNVDPAKAQYLYIDSTGVIKCADATIPRFNKLVIAEKAENSNFTINNFPVRAESQGWDTEITPPSVTAESKEETLYADAALLTKTKLNLDEGNTIIALSGLLEAIVNHVSELERKVVDNLTERLEYLEKVKQYLGAQIEIPDPSDMPADPAPTKLVMNNIETASTGTVNIKGAVTVDPATSSFGTADNPIHNLYVTTSLYTDQLFVTE